MYINQVVVGILTPEYDEVQIKQTVSKKEENFSYYDKTVVNEITRYFQKFEELSSVIPKRKKMWHVYDKRILSYIKEHVTSPFLNITPIEEFDEGWEITLKVTPSVVRI